MMNNVKNGINGASQGRSAKEFSCKEIFLLKESARTWVKYWQGFSDAFELAYLAVIYMILGNGEGAKNMSFVTSKSRIAPMGGQTISRMELMGAVILSRLIMRTKEALLEFVKIDEVI